MGLLEASAAAAALLAVSRRGKERRVRGGLPVANRMLEPETLLMRSCKVTDNAANAPKFNLTILVLLLSCRGARRDRYTSPSDAKKHSFA